LAVALETKDRDVEALSQFRAALAQEPDNVRVLNDAAWLLSTASETGVRDGREATALAAHAVELTRSEEPSLLGTLAAAQAEAGDFAKAMETEQGAAALADQQGKTALAKSLRAREALFLAKTPLRANQQIVPR
jgi:tetratricopeptide (TPR) repeat protein